MSQELRRLARWQAALPTQHLGAFSIFGEREEGFQGTFKGGAEKLMLDPDDLENQVQIIQIVENMNTRPRDSCKHFWLRYEKIEIFSSR